MIFVDASTIVAILTEEPDAGELERVLLASGAPITSAIAIFEATLAVCRKLQTELELSQRLVHEFLTAAGIEIVPISAADADLALVAHARFGKGRGHPAGLNMGDCFAYAVARSRNAALLYKSNDFSATDIRSAADFT